MKSPKYEFYDPHPGFGGAMIPLPTPALKLAERFDGKVRTLDYVLRQLRSALPGYAVELVRGCVMLRSPGHDNPKVAHHIWRLLRFKPAN